MTPAQLELLERAAAACDPILALQESLDTWGRRRPSAAERLVNVSEELVGVLEALDVIGGLLEDADLTTEAGRIYYLARSLSAQASETRDLADLVSLAVDQ